MSEGSTPESNPSIAASSMVAGLLAYAEGLKIPRGRR